MALGGWEGTEYGYRNRYFSFAIPNESHDAYLVELRSFLPQSTFVSDWIFYYFIRTIAPLHNPPIEERSPWNPQRRLSRYGTGPLSSESCPPAMG